MTILAYASAEMTSEMSEVDLNAVIQEVIESHAIKIKESKADVKKISSPS